MSGRDAGAEPRVLIVDDHQLFRAGVRAELEGLVDVAGDAATVEEAIEKIGALPADRRGVRESIIGRMARHGGRAEIHSAPGAGTEVELAMPRG